MRPRFAVSLLLLIVIVAVVIFWLRPKQHTTAPSSIAATVHSSNAPATNAKVVNQKLSKHNPQPFITPSAHPNPATSYAERRARVIKEYNEKNNGPIAFYGEVIDQDGNGLAGVKVNVSILQVTAGTLPTNDLAISPNVVRLEKITGTDGRFEITSETGANVTIDAIQKDDYKVEPGGRTFGPVSGSYENPVVFKMWSDSIHEKLIAGDKAFSIVPDGRPYFINLTHDTISESGTGDLKVWIQYTNQIVQGRTYKWSAGIEVINGGLFEESLGTAMYEAPASGYMPAFQLQGQIRGGQRGQIGERKFYLRLKDGKEYGHMTIDLIAPFNNRTPGLISLSYAINPSGSRILR